MLKRVSILLLFGSSLLNTLHATHIVGGEIRYDCLGNGNYRVELRVYRDCEHGVPFFDNPASVGVFRADGTLQTSLTMTPESVDTVPLTDNDPCRLAPHGLCVDVGYYQKTVNLPYASGGYYFVYQRCCRNAIVNNLADPLNTGGTYAVFMSGYAQQTCNSSPAWSDYPPVVVCLGQPLVFNHGAIDPEGDNIVYSFCAPSNGVDSLNPQPQPPHGPPYPPVVYTPGYSPDQPMGGNPLVSINPVSGLISGTPDHLGHFVMGVCGKEYRNGILLSEFTRDIQLIVSSCNQSVLVAGLHPATPCDIPLSAIDLVVENGTLPYSYKWSDGVTTEDRPSVQPGVTYTVTISDAAGCTSQIAFRGNECTWPGDADYNGTANNFDVLAIGLFYGDNGPERPGASLDWTPQPGPYWSDRQATGANTKHADCDGDGAINVFDVAAVSQNYTLSHPTAFFPAFNPLAPELAIQLDRQQFEPNVPVVATVTLGSAQQPAENVYGVAFTLVCTPPEAINSITPLFEANWNGSIFGDVNHSVRIAYPPVAQPARKELAICSTRRMSFANLSGLVGKFTFQLSEKDPGKPVSFSITDVRLIDAQGATLPVNPGSAVLAASAVQGPGGNLEETLSVFPNPAREQVTLSGSALANGTLPVGLYDSRGRQLVSREISASGGTATLNLPVLSAGLYWIRVFTPQGVAVGKLFVQ